MSKTPVSTLQEYMVRGSYGTPDYTLIVEQNGTHLASFTYKVKCGNMSAQGTASNKKEAKHNAAREMLKLLPCGNNITQKTQINTPSKSSAQDSYYLPNNGGIPHEDVFVNSIGKLSEHCASHGYKSPEFTVINQSGPSHMMMFTIKCSIGSLSADATASTKKQAKHNAAQNMYQLLIKTTTSKTHLDLSNSNPYEQCYEEAKKTIAKVEILDLEMPQLSMSSTKSGEKAKELFPKLRKRDYVKVVTNVQVNDYHEALKKSVNAVSRDTAQREIRFFAKSSKEMILNEVLKILDLQLEWTTVESQCHECVVRCSINSSPVIADVGIGKTVNEAKEQAIGYLLNSINLLLT